MAGATKRSEYFWLNDRLVRRVAVRRSGFARWPVSRDAAHLVCTIEMDRVRDLYIRRGPAYSPKREADAVAMEHGLHPSLRTPDIGRQVPQSLLRELYGRVTSAVEKVTRQFGRLANEERTTGALASDLDGTTLERDGWTIEMKVQGFSSAGESSKEPQMGGDLGVVVDIADGRDRRVVKGLLVQAKRSASPPQDPLALPDLGDQLKKCRRVTPESYGWIYTPDGVLVVKEAGARPFALPDLFVDALRCDRGDRSREAVASAADRNYVFEVLASGPRRRD